MLAAAQDGPGPVEAVAALGVGNSTLGHYPQLVAAVLRHPGRHGAALYGGFARIVRLYDGALLLRLVHAADEALDRGRAVVVDEELALSQGDIKGR